MVGVVAFVDQENVYGVLPPEGTTVAEPELLLKHVISFLVIDKATFVCVTGIVT